MRATAEHLWAIPALPLAAAAVISLLPRRCARAACWFATASVASGLVWSLAALAEAARSAGPLVANFAWFQIAGAPVRLGLLLDPLGAAMCVMVTAICTAVFVFSGGYMAEDRNRKAFFGYLSLFAAAMLGLVIANSLLLLFVCWEIVGSASYLLIGFWHERPAAAAAAKKAFLTTRIGDLGLFLGMLWLYRSDGTLLFYDHGAGVLDPAVLGRLAAPTGIALLLFCGAIGKSGQFPLQVWLPDAMEGPTPVSALIHAATMVAAGVFLLARVYPLMAADQALAQVPFHALSVVAGIGALTALIGAAAAVAQADLKRVLAYSTVSQLGYMMLAIGVGSWVAAIFHLLTHAFFKALLFLGAGSVIHATHHEQQLRRLGGLGRRLPATFATFAIGAMSLAGVPFLLSGYWSKEAILHAAAGWAPSRLPLLAALAGVALTAFYVTRMVALVFAGEARAPAAAHATESGPSLVGPLFFLSLGAVLLGFVGTPGRPWLQSFLTGAPLAREAPLGAPSLVLLSAGLLVAGAAAAWSLYGRRPARSADAPDPLAQRWPRLFPFLAAGLGFDRLYARTVVRAATFAAAAADDLDRTIWDGSVRAVAAAAVRTGAAGRSAEERALNGGFSAATAGMRRGARAIHDRQRGRAQFYLGALAAGFIALAAAIWWEGRP
ncbi:MAG TPA: NADH-quinone oxidoreductase subunit L [Opitutaceae bacterium]|jgi:NADH-quinone oxidoreductase subunit L|nr:NADH-quinone oxidoreductase subunit L [Opitutaceae bacterium]